MQTQNQCLIPVTVNDAIDQSCSPQWQSHSVSDVDMPCSVSDQTVSSSEETDTSLSKMKQIKELISDIKLGIMYKNCIYQQKINSL